jgi:hypothetical protein
MNPAPNGSVLQVAYVVRDLEAAIAEWTGKLGAGPFHVMHLQLADQTFRGQPASINAKIAIGYLGQTNIELIQPMDELPSAYTEQLQTRGPGLNHYWLAADDMDAEIARLEASGFPMIAYSDISGLSRSAMIDTSATLGCLTEIQELPPRIWEILGEMQAAHESWDGSDPIRPYPAP